MKSRITNKTFVLTAAIGSFMIMVTVIANTIWASRQTVTGTNEAVSAVSSFYLEAMADRRAKIITNLINNNFNQMQKVIDFINEEGIEDQDALRRELGRMKLLLSLNRLALVDEDDIVYTQYSTYTGGSRHEFLADKKMKDRVISTVSVYGSSRQLCLAIPLKGLTLMGKPFKACFVQIDIDDIVDLLALDDEGRTHFALYSSTGGNLSDTELGPDILKNNIFEATRTAIPKSIWEGMQRDFVNEIEGTLTLKFDETEETLCYVPIPGTGWQMAILIRGSVIHDQIQAISENNLSFSRYQITFTLVALFVFGAILLWQLKVISTTKLEAEKETSRAFLSMANTDSLTGIRNKHAFTEMENALNDRIRSGELKELAVVVCDINGLKHVNDTLGHAAGDKLIKDGSDLLCEHFKNGSVFRIGGDEFVVLLVGKGYETREESMRDLNRQVEANISTDEVVISIGCSTLEPGDEQLHDAFTRADQLMYERKKELKSMGAKTRES